MQLDFGWIPSQSVDNSDRSGFPDPDVVASVGLERWADVPTVETMWGPSFALVRFFVSEHSAARRAQGCTVEIESAMNLRPCR